MLAKLKDKRLLLILVSTFSLTIILGLAFFLLTPQKKAKPPSPNKSVETNLSEAERAGKKLSNNQCQGKEKRKLGTSPMKLEDFSMVLPYGLTIGGHVTPIDHQYFSPTDFHSPRNTYEVRAMADATIVDIGPRTNDKGTEYRLVFTISCKLFYYYDLVTSLAPDIKKTYEEGSKQSVNIQVKEGQLIGYIGGQTLDFAVWDTEKPLKGFAVPEHYKGESWKIFTADPLDYYTDELKKLILSKYIRTVEPLSGKIDHDIDGRLIGNWFKEGSGGYSGGGGGGDYYKNHLSVAPDAYDPTSIVFSIGDFNGEAKQFGVMGNAPDPKDVSVSSGLIKYELVLQDWTTETTGQQWDRMTFVKGLKAKNQTQVKGVVLLQMLEGSKLKVEVFPGKTSSQVSEFTSGVKIYER